MSLKDLLIQIGSNSEDLRTASERILAVLRRADVDPGSLGRPGGPCKIIWNVEESGLPEDVKEDLIRDLHRGEELDNSEAAHIYDAETVRLGGDLIPQVHLTNHAQYRMDLRSVTTKHLKSAFHEFEKWFNFKKKRPDSMSWEDRDLLEDMVRGNPVRFETQRLGLTIIFKILSNKSAKIISVWWQNKPNPRAPKPGECGMVRNYSAERDAIRRAMKIARGPSEGGFKRNVARMSVDKAREYAEDVFADADQSLDEALPNFDKNYELLRKKMGKAIDVPRIMMPVIEPKDMKLFQKRLEEGHIDLFKPYTKGHLYVPKNPSRSEGEEWVTLGIQDGEEGDDRIPAKLKKISVKQLFPTQSQIWLEKIVGNIAKYGPPSASSPIVNQTIIVSSDNYILDGHHRFAQAMVTDPGIKMKALFVPLPIEKLLKIGRAYGESIGNRPKASLTPKISSKTRYVHFTSLEDAGAILKSGKLDASSFVEGVYAVAEGGVFSPGVAQSKLGRPGSRKWAVVFEADDAPNIVYPEEVIWRRSSLRIRSAKVMPADRAARLLNGSRVRTGSNLLWETVEGVPWKPTDLTDSLYREVTKLLAEGQKISAIRKIASETSFDIRTARQFVEQLELSL